MNDTELWRLISEKVQEKRESIIHTMTAGYYANMEKYREDVGLLRGFEFIENTVKDIYQPKVEEEE